MAFVSSGTSVEPGVSGIVKRIEAIMSSHVGERLNGWNKLLLASAALMTAVAPVAVGVLNAPPLRAQSAAAPEDRHAFEVASVKPNRSRGGERANLFDVAPGGRFSAARATLRDLVQFAYALQDGRLRHDAQISGGPGWINSDHFDIVAKAGGLPAGFDPKNYAAGAQRPAERAAVDRIRLMVRTLLADRFKLTVHNETRELPVYALVMARSDGTLGPQFHKVEIDCASLRDGGRPAPPEPGKAPCGGFRWLGPGRLTGHGVTLPMLATTFSGSVDRMVLDRAGLNGVFDVDVEWSPDQPAQSASPDGSGPKAIPVDPSRPPIFTAVREQLGLKLESTKSPADVLVIESASQPTPD